MIPHPGNYNYLQSSSISGQASVLKHERHNSVGVVQVHRKEQLAGGVVEVHRKEQPAAEMNNYNYLEDKKMMMSELEDIRIDSKKI